MTIIYYEKELSDGDYLVEDGVLPGDIFLYEDGGSIYLEDGFFIYPEDVTPVEDTEGGKYMLVESGPGITNPDLQNPDGLGPPILFVNNNDRSRFEICQRTGFKQLPRWHPLTDFDQDGYGEYVRKRSVDSVHPQDKIKSTENAAQTGPQYAEPTDTFVDTVDVDDL